jgi:3-oxoacyl-[acyl-carrier-protein] synthase-3
LVQDRGGAELQTGGILLYVEDLKLGTNKDIGPKDIFEMGSNQLQVKTPLINTTTNHSYAMKRSIIKSTGRYLPDRHVKNEELTGLMDTSNEWIVKRTGIEARYWVREGEDVGTSDLAYEASIVALERADWNPPDVNVPGSGAFLQNRLGAKNVPALDIRQQCTGFLHGLEICDAYIRSEKAQRILLVGAEFQSRYLELTTENRDTAVIFADGAGAACIEAAETSEKVGIITSILHADGKYAGALRAGLPARKSGQAISPTVIKNKEHFPYMDGKNMQVADLNMVIPHQANLRINEAFRERMNIPEEKMYNNIQRYGNTTAATIPIALDELMEKNMLKPKDIIMLIGLGAGLTWGGVIYKLI